MSEVISGQIDQRVDSEFHDFAAVLNETGVESLYDYFDARTMVDPSLPTTCRRLLKYVDVTDEDSLFSIEAGIHFAVTISELAGYRTNRSLEILAETLSDYETMGYTQAMEGMHESVENYFEDNCILGGLVQSYLLTDIDETFDEISEDEVISPSMRASYLSAGMMFMAIEAQAASDSMVADVESLLRA